MNQIFISHSPEETEKAAAEFAQKLKKGEAIALCGELGSGKTTFVRGLFAGLGGDPRYFVTSPTFTLMQEYPTFKGPLYHFDFYRLEKKQDLAALDFEEYVQKKNGVIVVEWGTKFSMDWNCYHYLIELKIRGETQREITFQKLVSSKGPTPAA